MSCVNWYISFDYDPSDIGKLMKLLEALDYKNHKLLYGLNQYFISEVPDHLKEDEIEGWFGAYEYGVAELSHVNRDGLCAAMDQVLRDGGYKGHIDWCQGGRNQKIKELIRILDIETLQRLKRTFYEVTHVSSDLVASPFTKDKIRFRNDHENPFLCRLYKCWNQDHSELSYTWFDFDIKDIQAAGMLAGLPNIMITDDLENMNNYLYLVSVAEYNSYAIAVKDNAGSFDSDLSSALYEHFDDEKQFTLFRDELVKFI